jgi:hypothetical protein
MLRDARREPRFRREARSAVDPRRLLLSSERRVASECFGGVGAGRVLCDEPDRDVAWLLTMRRAAGALELHGAAGVPATYAFWIAAAEPHPS